ncbi:uncharacterized protein [Triticum aestivum]|uniref:uncharacterized protein isoform X3 n=1 Tax=Triticum aestivum TaxID=4565 RepID=UPI001D021EA4|nr:uncharacterized protein LOC123132475 isoform X3 [Triticum aestivum]XP_044408208.1 uncharacterized protein LOC123132475 isoform X3 [Triticum aestivum]
MLVLYSPWELNHGDAAGFSHGGGASSSSCWGKNGAWSKLRDEPYLARKDKSIMLIANVTSCTINLDKLELLGTGIFLGSSSTHTDSTPIKKVCIHEIKKGVRGGIHKITTNNKQKLAKTAWLNE